MAKKEVMARTKPLADRVQGMTKAEATALIEAEGVTWRLANEDGVSYMLTMDLHTDRINMIVYGGIVLKAGVG